MLRPLRSSIGLESLKLTHVQEVVMTAFKVELNFFGSAGIEQKTFVDASHKALCCGMPKLTWWNSSPLLIVCELLRIGLNISTVVGKLHRQSKRLRYMPIDQKNFLNHSTGGIIHNYANTVHVSKRCDYEICFTQAVVGVRLDVDVDIEHILSSLWKCQHRLSETYHGRLRLR